MCRKTHPPFPKELIILFRVLLFNMKIFNKKKSRIDMYFRIEHQNHTGSLEWIFKTKPLLTFYTFSPEAGKDVQVYRYTYM